MRTIIAGSRTATRYDVQAAIIACPFSLHDITEVVSGCNKEERPDGTITGADYWGEQWAEEVSIPVKPFPAQWHDLTLPGPTKYRNGKPYKPSAGPIRNAAMADYADALILVWDGKSRGSHDMLQKARTKGLRVFVWDYVKGCEVND